LAITYIIAIECAFFGQYMQRMRCASFLKQEKLVWHKQSNLFYFFLATIRNDALGWLPKTSVIL
jgi:hypothetical protein